MASPAPAFPGYHSPARRNRSAVPGFTYYGTLRGLLEAARRAQKQQQEWLEFDRRRRQQARFQRMRRADTLTLAGLLLLLALTGWARATEPADTAAWTPHQQQRVTGGAVPVWLEGGRDE